MKTKIVLELTVEEARILDDIAFNVIDDDSSCQTHQDFAKVLRRDFTLDKEPSE